jgi:uncharacterized protein Yka (UPF0111/DUF47 family)
MEVTLYFKEIINKGKCGEEEIRRLRDYEHTCDSLTYNIVDKLNHTFIKPFDREDIHSLAHELDRVVDMLYNIAKRFKLYKFKTTNPDVIQFTELIEQSVTFLCQGINGLRNLKNPSVIRNAFIKVNQLENSGDMLRDVVIEKLFSKTKDPIKIIQSKEIFEGLETVLDICEDIAKLVDSIIVKQA